MYHNIPIRVYIQVLGFVYLFIYTLLYVVVRLQTRGRLFQTHEIDKHLTRTQTASGANERMKFKVLKRIQRTMCEKKN